MALVAVLGVLLVTLAACSSDGDPRESNDGDPTGTPGNSATATALQASATPGNSATATALQANATARQANATLVASQPTPQPGNSNMVIPPGPTTTPSPSEMRLTADGCTADCAFALNQSFTLALEIINAPPTGYIALQSLIDYGDHLLYDAARRDPQEEIVWPDCAQGVSVRNQIALNLVGHGCLTAIIPPLPISNATGPFVEITLTCSAEHSSTAVRIVPHGDPVTQSSGTVFAQPDALGTLSVPSVSDLTIACG